MPWLRLEMQIEAPFVEPLSDALLELGAQSVTIEDAHADTAEEIASYGEPGLNDATTWRANRLSAIIDMQSDAKALVEAVTNAAGLPRTPEYRVTRVEDDDWVRRTQSQFGPLHIGAHLWIVPSWSAPPMAPDAVIIRLDPGLAFGTGSHATTRLVLAWLERALMGRARKPTRVLDYGCGSGILAVAAAKLGASDVVAIDLDRRALTACAENALANGVSIRIEPPERLPGGRYDVVLANILAGPLIELAPVFAAHTNPGAQIALSGVLADQASEVIAFYAANFTMSVESTDEDWTLLAGERR